MIVIAIPLALLSGCNDEYRGYIAAASIAENGFARNKGTIRKLNGREIKIWGYVDHSNIYADGADEILADWLGGNAPSPTTWRFDLKAKSDDDAGESFSVYVKNDNNRDKLLRVFIADAKAGKPTRVFVKGKLFTFDAPMNFSTLTGLRMEVKSTGHVLLEYPGDEQKQ